MSNLNIAAAIAALPKATFQHHGRHRGLQSGVTESLGGSVGQLPVATAQSLYSNAAQSLQQTLGAAQATSAASAVASAGSVVSASQSGAASAPATPATPATPAAPATSQNLQAFMHSLFQDLNAGGSATASLQSLIQPLGSGSTATPVNANLNASFNRLVGGLGGTSATGGSVNTRA